MVVVLLATTVVLACRPDAGAAPIVASALVLVPTLPRGARHPASVALIGVFAACVVAWIAGYATLDTAIAALVANVAFIGRSPTNDRLALAVCAVAMMRSAQDAPSVVYLAALAAIVFAGAPILVAAAIAEGTGQRVQPDGRLSFAVLALAVPLFVVLPRLADPAPLAFTGFSTDVRLGDDPAVLDDPAPVLTLALSARPTGPYYLRGAVFERFDGRAWSTRRPTAPAAPPAGDDPAALTAVVRASPVDEGVVFTLGQTVAIAPDGALRVDPAGAWRLDGPSRAATWTLRALPPFGPGAIAPGQGPDRADRELPPIDVQIQALAAEWAGDDPDPRAVVASLRAHLAGYAYTRTPDGGEDAARDPLLAFLTVRKAGHCEYFASALAVLARQQRVPARVVTGFAGGEWDEDAGALVVRASDAHAWVEVWLDGGWEVVDATPGPGLRDTPPPDLLADAALAWERTVDAFGPTQQRALLRDAGRLVLGPIGVVVLVAVALTALARAIRGATVGESSVTAEWIAARRALAAAGWGIPAELPPVTAAGWLRERVGDEAEPLERLAWLVYRVRYEGTDDRVVVGEARALRAAIAGIRGPTAFE